MLAATLPGQAGPTHSCELVPFHSCLCTRMRQQRSRCTLWPCLVQSTKHPPFHALMAAKMLAIVCVPSLVAVSAPYAPQEQHGEQASHSKPRLRMLRAQPYFSGSSRYALASLGPFSNSPSNSDLQGSRRGAGGFMLLGK